VLKVDRDLGIALSHRQADALLRRVRAFVGQAKRLPEPAELEAFHREIDRGSDHQSLTQTASFHPSEVSS